MNIQKPPPIPEHIRAQHSDLLALNIFIITEKIDALAMEMDKESGELLNAGTDPNNKHKRELTLMRLRLYSMQVEQLSQLMQNLLKE